MSVSKYSRLEGGQRRVNSAKDVETILDVFGVRHGPARARLMELAREASAKGEAGFHRDAEPEALRRLNGLVRRAELMISVDSAVVSGFLQTAEYVVAVTRATLLPSRQHRVLQLTAARMASQRAYLQDGPQSVFFMHQEALYRVIGGRDVMVAQMKRLMEFTETAGIGVRIIPVAMPLALHVKNMTKLLFGPQESLRKLIYVENGERSYYYTPSDKDTSQEFADYDELVDQVMDLAPGREESRRLIQEALARHRAHL